MKINILPDNSKKNRAPEPAPVFKPYYTGSSKALAFLGNNLLYLISFLFPVVVLFTLMALNSFAPFGDKNLFILDGSVYNLPHFATFVEQLHSGNFSFFMEGGVLGKEYFSTIVFYLTSPLHLLLCFFSQKTAIVLLAVVTVLQIGFAGFAMTFYLTHRLQGYRYSKYDYSVLLFSFAFSLSGYFLVQYNDFMYLDCVVLFPLLFLALEHLLYKDTYKYFYGLLAFCFFCNFYMAAIIFVLLFFYVLTRKKGDFTNSVAKCIKYLFTGIFAALTSAVTVIPGFYSLYQTQIKTSSAPDFSFVTDWLSFYGSFMPKNFGSYASTPYCGNNIYCGLFAVILFVVYITDKKCRLSDRIRNIIFVFFLCLISNIVSFQYVFHLFSSPTSSFNCYSFILPFFILTISSDAFYHFRSNASYKNILALLLPLAIMIIASLKSTYYSSSVSISFTLIMFVVYSFLVLFYIFGSINRAVFRSILLIAFMLELIINVHQNFNYLTVDTQPVKESVISLEQEPQSYHPSAFTIQMDNNVTLPVAYFLSPDFSDTNSVYATVFQEQNEIAHSLGAKEDLFTTANLQITYQNISDIEANLSLNNILTLRVLPDTAKAKNNQNIFPLTITPDQDGYLYLQAGGLTCIGKVQKDQSLMYKYVFKTITNAWSNEWIYGAYLNPNVITTIEKVLNTTSVSIKKYDDFSFAVLADTSESRQLVLNMPYSAFLSIHIDEQNTPYTQEPNNTVALQVPSGTHYITVKLNYVPFNIGLFISLIAICLLFTSRINNPKTTLSWIKQHLYNTAYLEKASNWLWCHRVSLASFFIPFLTLVVCCFLNGYAPFGPNNFFKGDGLSLSLPTMFQTQDQVKHNSFLLSWISGGGTNFFYTSPCAFLFYFLRFVSRDSIISFFTMFTIICISFSGYTFYYYMTHRQNSLSFRSTDARILILSTAYCLCAYIINFRNNILWNPVYLLFPLIILAMDRLMYEGKKVSYIILLALSIYFNIFIAFFICIYLIFVFFTYHFTNWKDFIKKGILFTYSSLLSAGISILMILPTYLTFQNTAYESSDSVFPTFTFYQSYWNSLKQLFPFSQAVVITDQNGAINLYCGVICIILFFLALFLKNTKKKIMKLLFIAFIFFSSNSNFFSYFWNGLHYQSKVPNRYSFLMIFMILDLGADVILVFRSSKKHEIYIAVMASILLILVTICFSSITFTSATGITAIIFLVLYASILILRMHHQRLFRISTHLIIFIAITELCLNCIYTFSQEDNDTGLILNQYDTATAYYKKELCTSPLSERVSYVSMPFSNINMIAGTNAMTQFNSYFSKYQHTIGLSLGYLTSTNSLEDPCNTTPFTNAVTNTGYMFVGTYSFDNYIDFDHYEPISIQDNILILRNTDTLGFGFYVPEKAIENLKNMRTAFSEEYANQIATGYDTPPIFTNVVKINISDKNESYSTKVYYEDNNSMRQKLSFTPIKSGTYYFRSTNYYYLGHLDAGTQYEFDFPCSDTNGYGFISQFNEKAFSTFYQDASAYSLQTTKIDNATLQGTIGLPKDGYIYLSIPYERGWSATVDGKEATIETAPEGFSMIKASAGIHEVHLTFRPYGLTVCIIGTLIAWIIFLFTILFERRHNKRMLLKAAEADTTLPPAHLRSHQQAEEPHCELPQACSSAPQAPQEGSLPDTACYTDTLSDRSGGQAPDSIADTSAASEMKMQG